jgi:DNA-binding transcriptional regulator YdaS (Cro superfamily)
MKPMDALAKAVEIAGTQAELARRVAKIKKNPRIKQAHVWNWLNRDEEVPADMVLAVEEAVAGTEESPTRYDLRPDLYPKERVAS